jgi:hypothetical protein
MAPPQPRTPLSLPLAPKIGPSQARRCRCCCNSLGSIRANRRPAGCPSLVPPPLVRASMLRPPAPPSCLRRGCRPRPRRRRRPVPPRCCPLASRSCCHRLARRPSRRRRRCHWLGQGHPLRCRRRSLRRRYYSLHPIRRGRPLVERFHHRRPKPRAALVARDSGVAATAHARTANRVEVSHVAGAVFT